MSNASIAVGRQALTATVRVQSCHSPHSTKMSGPPRLALALSTIMVSRRSGFKLSKENAAGDVTNAWPVWHAGHPCNNGLDCAVTILGQSRSSTYSCQ